MYIAIRFLLFAASGLDALHELTTAKNYRVRVSLKDWDGTYAGAYYDYILVAGEVDDYKLTLGSLSDAKVGKSSSRTYNSLCVPIDSDNLCRQQRLKCNVK